MPLRYATAVHTGSLLMSMRNPATAHWPSDINLRSSWSTVADLYRRILLNVTLLSWGTAHVHCKRHRESDGIQTSVTTIPTGFSLRLLSDSEDIIPKRRHGIIIHMTMHFTDWNYLRSRRNRILPFLNLSNRRNYKLYAGPSANMASNCTKAVLWHVHSWQSRVIASNIVRLMEFKPV
jgi:hypothetical protein